MRQLLKVGSATGILLLVAAVAGAAGITYKGYNVINIIVNGQVLTSDVPAINLDGRTMLPVRAIAEAVGADIQWDEAAQTVTLTTAPTTIASTAPTPVAPMGTIVEGVRGIVWGSSRATVRATEKGRLVASQATDTSLFYETSVQGMEVVIGYAFADDQLINAVYLFQHKHSNPTDYIDDYKNLKSDLIAKYGKPVIDTQRWKGDLYKDNDPSEWGMAVITGDLVYLATWETPQTNISIILTGDNYKANLGITYGSKDLLHLDDKKNTDGL